MSVGWSVAPENNDLPVTNTIIKQKQKDDKRGHDGPILLSKRGEKMKKNNVRIQDFMVKYSDDNAKVNTMISGNCHIIWVVASKDRSVYVIELCFSDVEAEDFLESSLGDFDNKVIVCKSGPAALKVAKEIQDMFDDGYDAFEILANQVKKKEEN